jgi:hypothetical protein
VLGAEAPSKSRSARESSRYAGRLMRTLLIPLLALSTSACSPLLGPAPEPSFPSTSTSSYSAPSYSAPSEPGVPHREAVSAGLVVRPDLLCIPFALRTKAEGVDKAISALQAAAEALGPRLSKAAGQSLRVRMRGFAVAEQRSSKKAREDEPAAEAAMELAATADGTLELPLAEGLDFWARSRLFAALSSALAAETRASAEAAVKATFTAPQAQLREPEAYRGKLMEQWVKRARAFADAAQSPAAPLQITDCTAPAEVAQRSISNEEVALSLAITCHIDAGPAARRDPP